MRTYPLQAEHTVEVREQNISDVSIPGWENLAPPQSDQASSRAYWASPTSAILTFQPPLRSHFSTRSTWTITLQLKKREALAEAARLAGQELSRQEPHIPTFLLLALAWSASHRILPSSMEMLQHLYIAARALDDHPSQPTEKSSGRDSIASSADIHQAVEQALASRSALFLTPQRWDRCRFAIVLSHRLWTLDRRNAFWWGTISDNADPHGYEWTDRFLLAKVAALSESD